MFVLFQKGGPLMWLLLLFSIIALALFAERWIYFRRHEVHVGEFLRGIINLIRRRHLSEALARCDEVRGPVALVVHAAIQHHTLPRTELREMVQDIAQLQIPKLEHNLPALATLAYLAPMVGLLGTVTGMISAFLQLQRTNGLGTVADLSGGIWEALVTTAAGLAIAIPTSAGYNYLVSRMQRIVTDMERAGIEVVQALFEKGQIIDFAGKTPQETGSSEKTTQGVVTP